MIQMLEMQNIIALLILGGAVFYVGSVLWKRTQSFSGKAGCADDCGCSIKTKISKIAH
jgi:hypothetical protein